MRKIENHGFSAIEVVLFLVIVGLIAGAGWYVMNHHKSSSSTDTTAQSSTSNTSQNAPSANYDSKSKAAPPKSY